MKHTTKKCILAVLFGLSILTGCYSAEKGKAMKQIEGKDGLFAIMDTSKGEIAIELYYRDAPLTVCNFVGLAEGKLDAAKGKPFYKGLKFHRVIENFMIQGGDPQGTGAGGPGYKFSDEMVPYTFDGPGYLAMANSGANTNGSQFFITHVPTDWLNGKHTIFGHVVSDSDQKVVNSIVQGDEIKGITIVRNGDAAKSFEVSQAAFNRYSSEIAEKTAAAKKAQFDKLVAGFEKTSNGIYWKTTKPGKGNKAGKGKTASVEYKGYLVNGNLFDASRGFHPQGHEPLEFKTGAGQMIIGFDQMVQDMKIGEVRSMVLPPELGYGQRGVPQAGIEGGAYICFDVQLVSVK